MKGISEICDMMDQALPQKLISDLTNISKPYGKQPVFQYIVMQSLEKATTYNYMSLSSYILLYNLNRPYDPQFLRHKVPSRKKYSTVPIIADNLTHSHGSKLGFQNPHQSATAQKAKTLAEEAD